jgi:hypothetical protein
MYTYTHTHTHTHTHTLSLSLSLSLTHTHTLSLSLSLSLSHTHTHIRVATKIVKGDPKHQPWGWIATKWSLVLSLFLQADLFLNHYAPSHLITYAKTPILTTARRLSGHGLSSLDSTMGHILSCTATLRSICWPASVFLTYSSWNDNYTVLKDVWESLPQNIAKGLKLDTHVAHCKTCGQNNFVFGCAWVWDMFCHIKGGYINWRSWWKRFWDEYLDLRRGK